jgi:hypothetical protein
MELSGQRYAEALSRNVPGILWTGDWVACRAAVDLEAKRNPALNVQTSHWAAILKRVIIRGSGRYCDSTLVRPTTATLHILIIHCSLIILSFDVIFLATESDE